MLRAQEKKLRARHAQHDFFEILAKRKFLRKDVNYSSPTHFEQNSVQDSCGKKIAVVARGSAQLRSLYNAIADSLSLLEWVVTVVLNFISSFPV